VLCYNGFAIPLRLGFNIEEDITSFLFWMDRMIDFLFLLDVVLNFRTGIINQTGHVEYTGIAYNYLRSWFLLDVVSAMPYELIFLAMYGIVDENSNAAFALPKLLRTARIFKILKMLKLLRLLRLRNIFARWEKALVIKHSISTVIKFFCFIFFIAHWCACAFFAIGAATEENWLQEQALHEGDALITLYVAAFYWSLSTITTIGYGDISARNPSERLFAVAAMIVGSAVYAYGITNIITLVSNINADKLEFRNRMDRLNTYMRFRNLPKSLQADIRNFFYERSGGENWHELLVHERDILNDLSPLLRTKVALLVNKRVIESVPFFASCSPRFILDIIMALRPEYFPPNEYVVQEGDVADRMYLIAKGVVDVLKWDKFKVARLTAGSYFGEMALLNAPEDSVRCASVRTQTYCDFRSLSFAALEEAVVKHPSARTRVLKAFVHAARKRRSDLSDLVKKWQVEDPEAATATEDESGLRVQVKVGLADAKTLKSFYSSPDLLGAAIRQRTSTGSAMVLNKQLETKEESDSDGTLSAVVTDVLEDTAALSHTSAPAPLSSDEPMPREQIARLGSLHQERRERQIRRAQSRASMRADSSEGVPSDGEIKHAASSKRMKKAPSGDASKSAASLRKAISKTHSWVQRRESKRSARAADANSNFDEVRKQTTMERAFINSKVPASGAAASTAHLHSATSLQIPAPNSIMGGRNFVNPVKNTNAQVLKGGIREAVLKKRLGVWGSVPAAGRVRSNAGKPDCCMEGARSQKAPRPQTQFNALNMQLEGLTTAVSTDDSTTDVSNV